jgi:hypothetical protein
VGIPIIMLLGLEVIAPLFQAQAASALPASDAVRIAEAFRLADAVGNRLWPEWSRAPFAVLLVTPEKEFLIRHPSPSADFTLVGEDTVLKQKVWSRQRKFPTHFLATFPVAGVPTIVIGQAENTEAKTSTRWVITLLHEHSHQHQYSQPGYYAGVDALGLSRGDQTGMWMLNYPFPYSKPEVKEHFSAMCRLLGDALDARERAGFPDKLGHYVTAKRKFQSLLKPDDYKYFAFQVWQEGIARYTEYHLAQVAATDYQASKEFHSLKDYTDYKEVARRILNAIDNEMRSVQLDKAKREVVYNFGAAEGLVLDRASPGWRNQYFDKKFSLDGHFGL